MQYLLHFLVEKELEILLKLFIIFKIVTDE